MIVLKPSGEWDTSLKRISREVEKLKIQIKAESIRFRLICIMSALIFGTIFICWLANQLFLPVFYQYSKINTLKASYVEVYEKLNEIDEHEESDNTSLEISLEKWSADNNISIYVIDWSRVYQMGKWMYLGEFIGRRTATRRSCCARWERNSPLPSPPLRHRGRFERL